MDFYLKNEAEPRIHTCILEIKLEDLTRLSSYFDRSSLIRLQLEVWYSNEYNFAMRGKENIRMLTAETFVEEKDSNGRTHGILKTSL